MNKSPLIRVKERFESKEKLVKAVESLANKDLFLDNVSEIKGIAKISNAKLLRLHDVLSHVKEKFGSRDKLIENILEAEKRTKDEGYKARLGRFPTPRLVDHQRAAERRAKRAAAAPAKPAVAKKRVARTKAARAKAAS